MDLKDLDRFERFDLTSASHVERCLASPSAADRWFSPQVTKNALI